MVPKKLSQNHPSKPSTYHNCPSELSVSGPHLAKDDLEGPFNELLR